jgi:hypothetical protein
MTGVCCLVSKILKQIHLRIFQDHMSLTATTEAGTQKKKIIQLVLTFRMLPNILCHVYRTHGIMYTV